MTSDWDFSDLRAVYVNCTLKRSPEVSNTQGLADKSIAIMRQHGVTVDVIRAVDHQIATGERLHQPQHDLPDLEPAAPRAHAQGRRRHPRPRQPALRVGRGLPLRLRQPRLPLTGGAELERPRPNDLVGCVPGLGLVFNDSLN
jgi:hypothetical protein